MIVVDIGCAEWTPETASVPRLIERFQPDWLYGFDPAVNDGEFLLKRTQVVMRKQAAWIYEGEVPFSSDGTRSTVEAWRSDPYGRVPCFDLAEFLLGFPLPVILKMDCEGAEHVLIPDLEARGAFEHVEFLLVEFHGDVTRPPIPVPWEPW